MIIRQSEPIPAEWQTDFRFYQQSLARRLGFLLSSVMLVLLPVFAILDATLVGDPSGKLVWKHILFRLPAATLSVTFLVFYYKKPQGSWPYPLLLALNLSVVGMVAAMFVCQYSVQGERLLYITQGLTIAIIAVATTTVYGARDLALIYGLPLLTAMPFLSSMAGTMPFNPTYWIHVPVAMGVGTVIATMLHQEHIRTFIARQQVEHNALTDALTDLPNRRAMQIQLHTEWLRAKRSENYFALIMADLDHFKAVNDQYGHEVGDEVLTILANRFNATLRGADHVARWGGEEFLMLIPSTNQDNALIVAEKIRRAVAELPFATSAGELEITLSLGVALHRRRESIDEGINRADRALYQAKHEGRNRVALAEN